MRHWERCSKSPRDETVAQLFEKLIEQAMIELTKKGPNREATEEEDKDEDEYGDEEETEKKNEDPNRVWMSGAKTRGKTKHLARNR